MVAKTQKNQGLEVAQGSKAESSTEEARLAAVLIRGLPHVNYSIAHTLEKLRLTRKHRCIVVRATPAVQGMLMKAKDFVTWGEISNATFDTLIQKRGKEFQAREQDSRKLYSYRSFIEHKGKKYKPYFSLNPPRKGFGVKGIKTAFAAGGSVGYRGVKMNDLLQRMM